MYILIYACIGIASVAISILTIGVMVGFDLLADLVTYKPNQTAVGRDGQALGCLFVLLMTIGLMTMIFQMLCQSYGIELPKKVVPAKVWQGVPYTQNLNAEQEPIWVYLPEPF